MRFNNIKVVREAAFASLRRVTSLLLEGNPNLSEIEPQAFIGLSALLRLNISGARVTELKANAFAGLTKLQTLEFTHNKLAVVRASAFKSLDALVKLDLRGNSIEQFSPDMFQGLRQLRYLYTDAFKFCCLAKNQIPFERCKPRADEISDCEHLIELTRPYRALNQIKRSTQVRT